MRYYVERGGSLVELTKGFIGLADGTYLKIWDNSIPPADYYILDENDQQILDENDQPLLAENAPDGGGDDPFTLFDDPSGDRFDDTKVWIDD